MIWHEVAAASRGHVTIPIVERVLASQPQVLATTCQVSGEVQELQKD